MSDYRLTDISLVRDHLFNATLTFRGDEYNVEVVDEGGREVTATKVEPAPTNGSNVDANVLGVIAVEAVKNVRFDMRDRTYNDI